MSLLTRIARLEAQLLPTGADGFALRLEDRLAELQERYATGWVEPDGPDLTEGLSFKEKCELIRVHSEECDRDWQRFQRQRGDDRHPGHGDLGDVPEPTRGGTGADSEAGR